MDTTRASRSLRPVAIALGVVVVLVVATLAWTVGPLAGRFDPASLAARAAQLRDWPPAPFVVVALFVAGNVVAVPSTLMIATTILVFGALPGGFYAWIGMVVSGSAIYAIGRFAARAPVERWVARQHDPRLASFHARVTRHALLAVALLRLTPIPYPLQNVALGAARIGYGPFVGGTMLGILPAILLMAGIATQLRPWIATPDPAHTAWAVVVGIVVLGGLWWIRRRLARRP